MPWTFGAARGEAQVVSIARHVRFDFDSPGVDAAGNIANCIEAAIAQEFRHAETANTGMAEDEQVFVAGQCGGFSRDFAHRDMPGLREPADFELVGLPYIDDDRFSRMAIHELFGLSDGDFEGKFASR